MNSRTFTLSALAAMLPALALAQGIAAGLPLKKGQSIFAARKALKAQGWTPRITYAKLGNDDLEHSWGDAGKMFSAGLIEVESCAGTGTNPCVFNYRNKQGQCLRVVTLGEFGTGINAPTIDSWSSTCPPAEAFQGGKRARPEAGRLVS